MPAKCQILIILGQQTILNMQETIKLNIDLIFASDTEGLFVIFNFQILIDIVKLFFYCYPKLAIGYFFIRNFTLSYLLIKL